MLKVSRPRPQYRRLFFVFFIGMADCVLLLGYWPALADSLESAFIVQPTPPTPPLPRPDRPPDALGDIPGTCQPPTVSADKAPLDDDTLVIGVLAGGHARAYLLEAFQRGPASHLVNDLLGGVPISVVHCDISGCTRVFTGAADGQPLALMVGGRKDARLILRWNGQFYRQETSEPLDKHSVALPYREYPADLTVWGNWRQAHPQTDVYMGSIEEATPPEAGGPQKFSSPKSATPVHHAS